MKPQLTTANQRTYDAVFAHPIARNLHWKDLRAMLAQIGQVADEHNGNLKVTCNGQTLVLRPAHNHVLEDVEELMSIRHFLVKLDHDTPAADTHNPAPASAEAHHLLVVIDHRQARIYTTELHGAVPQHLTPYDPHGFGRQLHYVQDDSNGQRKPERKSFYEAVIKTLQGAAQILIFGSATGESSAMVHLVAEINKYHPQLAQRIVGQIVVDPQHMSENQLLATARTFYAQHHHAVASPA